MHHTGDHQSEKKTAPGGGTQPSRGNVHTTHKRRKLEGDERVLGEGGGKTQGKIRVKRKRKNKRFVKENRN